MAVESTAPVRAPDPSFDERWAAWLAGNVVHDRTGRKRALTLFVVAAAIAIAAFALRRPF